MKKKLAITTLMLIILASTFLALNQTPSLAATATPASLKIYIGPTSVPADANTYNCIFVQLLDSTGKPARAIQDTTITLSSSSNIIGTVDQLTTILAGTTYASANFTTTLTSGSTTITASATGYSTVQTTLTTITPVPASIDVFGFPSTLPADGGTYPAIMIQLQDSSGRPQRAQNGISVTLSCSDNSIGYITPSVVTIPAGSTYAIASFTTTPAIGTAKITTLANGYASNYMLITTKPTSYNPKNLVIFPGPNQILADSNSYPQVAVELQDPQGNIAYATSDITVNLISTDTNIGQITQALTIGPFSQFQTYGVATFNSTYKPGTTTIVAAANNLNPTQQNINTIEFIPPKLAVYAVPSTLPSDNGVYPAIQVQLQDSSGRPAKNLEGDVTINLFSQNPNVANISSTLIIPSGKTQATAYLTVTNTPGTTTITAQAQGYSTGQAQLTTYTIDYSTLHVAVTANSQSVASGANLDLSIYITNDAGTPITGVTTNFAASNGGTFTKTSEQGNGYYKTTFTAPSFSKDTTVTITASATKTGYIDGQGTIQITVQQASSTNPTPTPTGTTSPTPTPTPTPTSNVGSIALCIKDANGNPLGNAIVSSTDQPAGMRQLFDITNETGYVTFQNATAGSYTFKITKEGYPSMNATFSYNGQAQFSLPISLVGGSNAQNSTSLVIIAIVTVAIFAAVAVAVIIVLRRNSSKRIRKLKELQKQLKYDEPSVE